VGSGVDEVKESLLAYRFTGEEAEDEFLQERLPQLVNRVCVSDDTLPVLHGHYRGLLLNYNH